MKTPEDEAFDELARRQGMWGGGFPAKRAMAADKLQEPEREALKLALEALEEMQKAIYNIEGEHVIGLSYAIEQADVTEQTITTIKEALAQPAQEPNTITFSVSSADWVMRITADRRIEVNEGVEVTEAAQKVLEAMRWMLKPAQEPVAWAVVGDGKFGKYEIGRETLTDIDSANYWISRGYKLVSIYTTPPQRPWVGLTEKDFSAINQSCLTKLQAATSAESILKERNL
jgi:hypothetical protein